MSTETEITPVQSKERSPDVDSTKVSSDSVWLSSLSSTELSMLVSLVAEQHLIVRCEESELSLAQVELETAALRKFGFTSATVACTASISLESFVEATLIGERGQLDNRKVANVVIAKHLHLAERNVQIQALELMRSRRVFSRTAVHSTPSNFLLIALLPAKGLIPPLLTPHLNDRFFMLHEFEPTLNASYPSPSLASSSSNSSFFSKEKSLASPFKRPSSNSRIGVETITLFRKQSNVVRTTAEIRRYIHNIPTFLRLHRAVAGGVSALSTQALNQLAKILATINGTTYITPSLIAMAARKVYPHRIEVVRDPSDERSMQWGSEGGAVAQALRGVTAQSVLEEVLDTVECPL